MDYFDLEARCNYALLRMRAAMATRHRGFTIVEYSIVGVGVLFPGAAIYFGLPH
jgi:hypothetical protein